MGLTLDLSARRHADTADAFALKGEWRF